MTYQREIDKKGIGNTYDFKVKFMILEITLPKFIIFQYK